MTTEPNAKSFKNKIIKKRILDQFIEKLDELHDKTYLYIYYDPQKNFIIKSSDQKPDFWLMLFSRQTLANMLFETGKETINESMGIVKIFMYLHSEEYINHLVQQAIELRLL